MANFACAKALDVVRTRAWISFLTLSSLAALGMPAAFSKRHGKRGDSQEDQKKAGNLENAEEIEQQKKTNERLKSLRKAKKKK